MKPFLSVVTRVLGGLLVMASASHADGPAGCKTRINLSPRVYAAHEGNFGVKILPKQDPPESSESYVYETGLLIYQLNPDGSEKTVSHSILDTLPLQVLVSKRGDVVSLGHHGVRGDAGVVVSIYGKDGKRKGTADFITVLEGLSGADRNLAYPALTEGRGAAFRYDWYNRDFVVLPVSPKRTVWIALDNGDVVAAPQ